MKTDELISQLKTKQTELNKIISDAKTRMREETQTVIGEVFKEYFEKHGDLVYAIFWTQYTPYFNDGEECYFSVNDINIAFSEETFEAGESDDHVYDNAERWYEHLEIWKNYEADPRAAYTEYLKKFEEDNRRFYSNSYYKPTPIAFDNWKPSYYEREVVERNIEAVESGRYKDALRDFNKLKKFIEGVDDGYMEMIYGDHVKVIYSGPDGRLEIDEYGHE